MLDMYWYVDSYQHINKHSEIHRLVEKLFYSEI